MVISGGAGTLLGPIVGAALVVVVKSVVSGFIERWKCCSASFSSPSSF